MPPLVVRLVGMQVTIDRSKWLRGEGSPGSRLIRERDKKQCCIGFVCLTAGIPANGILGRGSPMQVDIYKLGPWDFKQDNDTMFAAFALNDAIDGHRPDSGGLTSNALLRTKGLDGEIVDDADREARLTKFLATVGIELTFVDGPVEAAAPAAP